MAYLQSPNMPKHYWSHFINWKSRPVQWTWYWPTIADAPEYSRYMTAADWRPTFDFAGLPRDMRVAIYGVAPMIAQFMLRRTCRDLCDMVVCGPHPTAEFRKKYLNGHKVMIGQDVSFHFDCFVASMCRFQHVAEIAMLSGNASLGLSLWRERKYGANADRPMEDGLTGLIRAMAASGCDMICLLVLRDPCEYCLNRDGQKCQCQRYGTPCDLLYSALYGGNRQVIDHVICHGMIRFAQVNDIKVILQCTNMSNDDWMRIKQKIIKRQASPRFCQFIK